MRTLINYIAVISGAVCIAFEEFNLLGLGIVLVVVGVISLLRD